MPHYFVAPSRITSPFVEIIGDTSHHLISVLRIKPGEKIDLFDGEGNIFQVVVERIEKKSLRAKIIRQSAQSRPALKIHLFCGILKGAGMELLLEKATEAGAGEITPLVTDRTIVRLKDGESKLLRWQKKVLAACEQSARAFIPPVNPPLKFSEAIGKNISTGFNILAWEEEDKKPLRQAIADYRQNFSDQKTINIFVGPEGGFTPAEAGFARHSNYQIITLGKTILKAETAPLPLLFILQYELTS
ncbi:MAG: RsmE family RNA methyltransferase [Elusimicrobiota bacterium]